MSSTRFVFGVRFAAEDAGAGVAAVVVVVAVRWPSFFVLLFIHLLQVGDGRFPGTLLHTPLAAMGLDDK